jgi:hypothetical protein
MRFGPLHRSDASLLWYNFNILNHYFNRVKSPNFAVLRELTQRYSESTQSNSQPELRMDDNILIIKEAAPRNGSGFICGTL